MQYIDRDYPNMLITKIYTADYQDHFCYQIATTPDAANSQDIGGAITYAKRYALIAHF
jgi:hypothetical protein